jgi:hypothetical protein
VIREDLETLNEILDKLTENGFFEYYKEIRTFYEYLAVKYHFDLKTHTINPATGEIISLRDGQEFLQSDQRSTDTGG